MASPERIDAALLDVRLGQETSAAIVEELLARAIPVAFATGCADNVMLPDHLRQMPRLSKPYVDGEIVKMLDGLIGAIDPMPSRQQPTRLTHPASCAGLMVMGCVPQRRASNTDLPPARGVDGDAVRWRPGEGPRVAVERGRRGKLASNQAIALDHEAGSDAASWSVLLSSEGAHFAGRYGTCAGDPDGKGVAPRP